MLLSEYGVRPEGSSPPFHGDEIRKKHIINVLLRAFVYILVCWSLSNQETGVEVSLECRMCSTWGPVPLSTDALSARLCIKYVEHGELRNQTKTGERKD